MIFRTSQSQFSAMKHILLLIFVFAVFHSFSQEKEFYLQGQIVDRNNIPISDAYIINFRNSDKNTSRANGVFDARVLPSDSLVFSHVSFFRKVVSIFDILKNPVVEMQLDTININPINISASKKSDYEKAMENIESIKFDFRPQPDDAYTETERMRNLLNTENDVERAASYSLNLLQFSPSEEIGKLINKRKKRKEAKRFSSTKNIKQDEPK